MPIITVQVDTNDSDSLWGAARVIGTLTLDLEKRIEALQQKPASTKKATSTKKADTKKEPEPEPEVEEAEEPTLTEDDGDESDALGEQVAEEATHEQAVKALQAYAKAHGRDTAIDLMEKVTGQRNVGAIKDGVLYGKLVAALKE